MKEGVVSDIRGAVAKSGESARGVGWCCLVVSSKLYHVFGCRVENEKREQIPWSGSTQLPCSDWLT